MDICAFVLTLGIIARLTRLATTDAITEPLRQLIAGPAPDPNQPITRRKRARGVAAYWASCPWCIGLAISIGVSTAAWHWHDQPAYIIAGVAALTNMIYATAATAVRTIGDITTHLVSLANQAVTRTTPRTGRR